MLSSHNKVEANDQWILPVVGLNSGEHADRITIMQTCHICLQSDADIRICTATHVRER